MPTSSTETGTRQGGKLWPNWATILCCAMVSAASTAPVAYWPFEGSEGAVVIDRMGNVEEGRLFGVTRCPGQVGDGLRFPGTGGDGYVRVPDCEALQLQGAFTIQFWWHKTGEAVQIFVRKGEGRQANTYAYYEGGLHLVVSATDGQDYRVTGPALPDGWHHLAFTCDERRLCIIADGEIVGTGAAPGVRLFADESDLLIGTYAPGYKYCLGGVLDELCLSDTALPADRLEDEMEIARAVKPPTAQGPPPVFEPAAGVVVLAREGRPGATIVVAREASELQMAPARELQRVIRKLTGARLPIRRDDEQIAGNVVLVGESVRTRQMGLSGDALGGDAFIIKSGPGYLVLLGHDESMDGNATDGLTPGRCKTGTSHAVHAFLHDVCKVRWFMPGKLGEIVPHSPSLEVPALEHTEQPARLYVLGSFRSADGAGWAQRQLFGSSLLIKHSGGHLWYSMIPEKEHFAEHPEWFALIDGKRTGEGNHLCVSNEAMFAEAAAYLNSLFSEGYEWVELGQSDGWRRCRCERCEAADDYRSDGWWIPGCPADRIFSFHAALAEEALKAHPQGKVLLISYGPTGEVPGRLERLPDNVVVEFTHDPPELLERWNRFHHSFTSYVYWFGLYHEMGYGPKSSPTHVAAEMRRHRAAGSQAFFLCGGDECWGTEAPTYYVMAQLLRDPSLDEATLLRDFCDGLFGEAGGTMREYFTTFLEAADDYRAFTAAEVQTGEPYRAPNRSPEEVYRHCFPQARLLSCAALLQRAQAELTTDDERRRLQLFQDGFDYVRLTAEAFAAAQRHAEDDDEASRMALTECLRRRAELVEALVARGQASGADLPPVFRAGTEDLLFGPGKAYAGVFATDSQ